MRKNRNRYLFPPQTPPRQFAPFEAEGFAHPVVGVVYEGAEVSQGVPLGGLGTGYVDFNANGTLGKCTMFNSFPQPRHLNAPFLSLTYGSAVRVLTVTPPEGIRGAQRILYWGHFPVADAQFVLDIPLEVNVRAWSPFVPGDADASNVPAAIFEVSVRNTANRTESVCLSFTFPGPTPRAGETFARQTLTPLEDEFAGVSVTHGAGGYVLGLADSEGEIWWHGAPIGTAQIPWERMADPDVPDVDPREPGATISIVLQLRPNQTEDLSFILAWFYPRFRDSDSMPLKHRYATRFSSAKDVALFVDRHHDALLRRTLAWQSAIYQSDQPDWLKDALINGLYSLAKNTFWLHSDLPDDWWGPQGLFTHSESFTGCPITETMVCRFHGHFPLLFLFPELELTTLRAFAHYQLKSGEIPFSFGRPTGHFRPHYTCQHPLNSAQYVQLVYRYYQRVLGSGFRVQGREGEAPAEPAVSAGASPSRSLAAESFLREFYDSVKDAVRFCKRLDTDSDGLVNDHSHAPPGEMWPANQFYDIWPWHGTSAYVAGTWLATLRCAEAMAEAMGDKEFAADCRVWFARGMKSYEEKLWTGKYYRLYNEPETERVSDVCLFNQLMGEWCSRVAGLGGLFPAKRVKSALPSLLRLNVKAGKYLPCNGATPDAQPYRSRPDADVNDHASGCFVGESLCAAMTMIYNGREKEGLAIARTLYEAIALRHATPWNWHCLLASDDGRPVWGPDYYSDLVIWALPMALAQQGVGEFAGGEWLKNMVQAEENER